MTATKRFDPRELTPVAFGFGIGILILVGFVILGLGIGLTPSIVFGVPYQ